MSENNVNTVNEVATPTVATPKAKITSTIKDLVVATEGNPILPEVMVSTKFVRADVTQSKENSNSPAKTYIRVFVEGINVPIFRSLSQAQVDLQNYVARESSKHMSPMGIANAYALFYRNKTVYFSASAHDEGATYIVDKDSSVHTRDENKIEIGTVMPTTSAGIRTGYLVAEVSHEEAREIFERELKLANEKAEKIANGTVASIF